MKPTLPTGAEAEQAEPAAKIPNLVAVEGPPVDLGVGSQGHTEACVRAVLAQQRDRPGVDQLDRDGVDAERVPGLPGGLKSYLDRASHGRVRYPPSGGMVKKSLVSELPGPSAQTFKLANVNDGDSLGWVVLVDGGKEILLATAQAMAIRFSEEEVRPMGLAAAGVNGIKLGVGDFVIGVQILPAEGEIFLVASDGKAKRVEQKDFPVQGRYGKGVIGWELPARVTLAGLAAGKKNDIITLHMVKAAPKMTRLDAAPLRKRSAVRGEPVVEVKPGDGVLEITEVWAVERFVALGKKEVVTKQKNGMGKKVTAKK